MHSVNRLEDIWNLELFLTTTSHRKNKAELTTGILIATALLTKEGELVIRDPNIPISDYNLPQQRS